MSEEEYKFKYNDALGEYDYARFVEGASYDFNPPWMRKDFFDKHILHTPSGTRLVTKHGSLPLMNGDYILFKPEDEFYVFGRRDFTEIIRPLLLRMDALCQEKTLDLVEDKIKELAMDKEEEQEKDACDRKTEYLVDCVLGVPRGRRHKEAVRLAGILIAEGSGYSAGWKALMRWNAKNRPPLKVTELRKIWGDIQAMNKENRDAQSSSLPNAVHPQQQEKDPWAHRSKGMRCRTCMWFVSKADSGPETGRCRRHVPTMNGYPVVFTNDWCGDHKLA